MASSWDPLGSSVTLERAGFREPATTAKGIPMAT
eukprot:CAMPEP_0184552160 /NCGR_PEP_ID=MMETSP0199_2-20130426/28015_1 /TAXON_ID=1112570 /ORGANISM="Thraustochytrium sp., Strain LLF1b" /LENGTH=33 /DNA_ID= /DNA_START= /DNA_END= /DNA_ORIENTATION=